MKGQQIFFYNFLPGVTVAILTTQPTLAQTAKVGGVQQPVSINSISTSTDGGSLEADSINTQLPYLFDNSLPAILTTTGVKTFNAQLLSSNGVPVLVGGKTGLPIGHISGRSDKGAILSLAPASYPTQQLGQNLFEASSQKQSNPIIARTEKNRPTEGKLITQVPKNVSGSAPNVTRVESKRGDIKRKLRQAILGKKPKSNSASVPSPVPPERLEDAIARTAPTGSHSQKPSPSLQQPSGQTKNTNTQLSEFLQNSANNSNSAKLLEEVQFCSNTQENSGIREVSSNSPTSNSCLEQNLTREVRSQAIPPTPTTPTTPAPVVPRTPAKPTTQTAPQAPGQIPDYLNPSPNPLQFPTRPEEVRVQGTQPITLEQAIELARRNNRQLQVSLLELERAQAQLREAQAALYPNFGLNAGINRQQSAGGQLQAERQADLEARQNIPEQFRTREQSPTTAFSGAAQLNYDLYTSGRRSANISAAEEQVRFEELDVEQQSEEIRLNVTTNYYDLQQAGQQVRIAESAVRNAEASLRDAQALERAGVGTRFDVLQSQVNLANAQQDLTEAISQQRIQSSRLAALLSVPASISISAADAVKIAGLWNQTLEDSIVLAFQNRPELQQFLAQRNISEQRRRLALSQLGPQVSLVASYELLDVYDDSFGVTDGLSIGLQANLNLFDGGAARARAAQERTNIRIAETQFAQQRNQIRFEVEQAFSNLQSNLENVQTSNAALDQAREALRLARLRFQAGVGTQTDVINAENALTRAEGNRVEAILNYNRALANLQRSVTSRGLR